MSSQTGTEAEPHGGTAGAQPGEDPKQRVDRELRELLEEIRVAIPGLELLFGFLLILPFSERFGALETAERGVYLACLLVVAAAMALFVAPTAQHRLGFRTIDKELMLMRTNRQIICGLVLIGVAISLAVYLVCGLVVDSTWPPLIAAAVALWFAIWWFLVPPFWNRNGRARS
jgi:hypothetical protein